MRKGKAQRKVEKSIKTMTRKLLKKYPFLEFYKWDRNKRRYVRHKPRLAYIYPFDDGWMKCFFYQMMNEIKDSLIKTNCLKLFMIDQYKEKYGSMRLYVSGCTRETLNIIDKYSLISQNVCIRCGKPDVGYTTGWIQPICRECYSKSSIYKYNKVPYEEMVDMSDTKIHDSYTVRTFSNGETTEITYDISDTVNKIRERWNKRNAKLS